MAAATLPGSQGDPPVPSRLTTFDLQSMMKCLLVVDFAKNPSGKRSEHGFSIKPTTLALTIIVAMLGVDHAGAAGFGITPADQIKVPDGFEVELVHTVDAEIQGSWVSLAVDPQGRLITCDQYGGLFRIDLSGEEAAVEKLNVDFQGAQGLLCAHGSLYAGVNSRDQEPGLYRLTDTTGDDQYDQVERLIETSGGSEHGPHAVIPTADGKRLLFVGGNNASLPDHDRSRAPEVWDEDHLIGRMPDARGHNAACMAPGGWIVELNPDGSEVTVVCTGFRNPYDMAINRDGELFTYDADMEWDVGTPWYRPTRVNHVISGVDFGWRNGTGKWPEYYPDSFGSAVDIGPGSPTGVVFGYGSNFPPKYRDALFICDWSYGNIHAVTLTPDGASYSGEFETFASASPMPVTDLVVHPDGSMYFTVGGRKTQSGLYRIKYSGEPAVANAVKAPKNSDQQKFSDREIALYESMMNAEQRAIRHRLEALHVADDELPGTVGQAVALTKEYLGDDDRAIAAAARIALEHRDPPAWKHILLSGELAPPAKILAIVALARTAEPADHDPATSALLSIDFASLPPQQRINYLRAASLIALRLGDFNDSQAKPIRTACEAAFPTDDEAVNRELAKMLVHLNSESATATIVEQLTAAPSQQSQIDYAMTLRDVTVGWTPELRRQYLGWFKRIAPARGGRSFGGFIDNIQKAAVESIPEPQREQFAELIDKAGPGSEPAIVQRDFVRKWTVDELVAELTSSDLVADIENGKQLFAAGQCYSCHRMGLQGGILGPDLTSAAGKFTQRDMLVSIVEPSREISDQYGSTKYLTEDGVVVGRVVNLSGNQLTVMTNMLDPSSTTGIHVNEILESQPATISPMPAGLLDTFTIQEVADLLAYLSSGQRRVAMK